MKLSWERKTLSLAFKYYRNFFILILLENMSEIGSNNVAGGGDKGNQPIKLPIVCTTVGGT